mmetsp:Transcript_6881/g.11473  ORF Transcript_6881/g.11473 Transcript_6881/m.11473 type:complete len:227 (+) Transcript_6881:3946-4626(+)
MCSEIFCLLRSSKTSIPLKNASLLCSTRLLTWVKLSALISPRRAILASSSVDSCSRTLKIKGVIFFCDAVKFRRSAACLCVSFSCAASISSSVASSKRSLFERSFISASDFLLSSARSRNSNSWKPRGIHSLSKSKRLVVTFDFSVLSFFISRRLFSSILSNNEFNFSISRSSYSLSSSAAVLPASCNDIPSFTKSFSLVLLRKLKTFRSMSRAASFFVRRWASRP